MFVDYNEIVVNIDAGVYRYIGAGSGREVFDMGNGFVVKVAVNKKGVAQNKTEYSISNKENSIYLAPVIAMTDNYEFLLMEKAESVQSFRYIWKYFNVKSNSELVKKSEIKYLIYKYHLESADLKRKSSWGFIDGRPVIVDYGFTKEVKKKYYR